MVTIEYAPRSQYRTGPDGRVNVADKADIFDEENKRWLPMKGGGANVSP